MLRALIWEEIIGSYVNELNKIFSNFCYFCSTSLAPSSPPTNVTVNALSTTINVTWNAPDGIDQNGIIMRFNVSYRGSPFDTALQSVIVGVNPVEYPLNRMFQVSLNTLEEFNVYYINVLAINQIGEGPTSPISSVRTTQSSKYFKHCVYV